MQSNNRSIPSVETVAIARPAPLRTNDIAARQRQQQQQQEGFAPLAIVEGLTKRVAEIEHLVGPATKRARKFVSDPDLNVSNMFLNSKKQI